MADNSKIPAWLESVRSFLNVMRDGLLLILLLMLLLIPSSVNDVLTKAGFTSASILGFDWEKQLEESSKETEAAKLGVQRLNRELGVHVAQIEKVASTVSEPAAKRQADEVARSLRASQSTAQKISAQLGRNLAAQKELQNEFRRRIPTRTP